MASAALLHQPSVLWSCKVDKKQYGDHSEDVTLSEPVLITGITILPDGGNGSEKPQVFKAWARDLSSPAAARFTALIGVPVTGPCEANPVSQLFASQHVVLRGRCSKVTLQLVGYPLISAPQLIKDAAEARLCPLPDMCPVLSPLSTQQQSLQDQLASSAAAPNMQRSPGQMLPLRKIPPAFVLTLAPLAQFWGAGRDLPLPEDVVTNSADLQACEQLAAAVLAAKRGNPAPLMAKLSTAVNQYNLAVDWDGIRDSVLDMATYCCSAMATSKINQPVSAELAMAGVCAAILVVACQDTAVQLLKWPGRPRPAAMVITELVSVPHPPQRLQDYGSGLVDILMESCPALACAAVQGTFSAAAPAEPPPAAAVPDRSAQGQQAAAASGGGGRHAQWARSSAGAADSGADHVVGSPAKRQRLDGRGSGVAGSGGAAGAAPSPSDSAARREGHIHDAVGVRQSDVVASAVKAECGQDVVHDGEQGASQSAGADVVMRQGSGDVEYAGDVEDDGGLYDGLQGDEGGVEGAEGDPGARSRSGSPVGGSQRPGEEGDADDPYDDADHAEGGGGFEGEGEVGGYEHDGYQDEEGEEVEQLDFEDTEFTGMHGDVVDGAVEQDGSDFEGHMQEHMQDVGGDPELEHAGSDDSMGQQQGSQEEGVYVKEEQQDGDQQQQDEQQQQQQDEQQQQQQDEQQQQQDEQQQQQDEGQQEEAAEEPETGEYRTDEYEEFQEDSGASADEAPVDEPAAKTGVKQRQHPPPQLYYGQLYGAFMKMTLSPLHQDAASSCASVLRRLRAYACLDTLQSTVGPMLAGKVNALLLAPPEFCTHLQRVAAATSDLATLVLQPDPSKQRASPAAKPPQTSGSSSSQLPSQQRQEADACVLQLILGFRALNLLAALVIYIGVHICRLVELQRQLSAEPLPSAEQQQQQLETAEQQALLCREHAQLLDAIRALTSALTGSAGGWSFLLSAKEGLAALAAAVCPSRQVSLDGGTFSPNASAPYDPATGWETERSTLLAAAAGFSTLSADVSTSLLLYGTLDDATAAAAAATDLSDSLQRLWVLVEATDELQNSKELLSGGAYSINAGIGFERLNAALVSLFKGGFASDMGQQSLVAALASNMPALRQLVLLLEQCGKVQVAAAEKQEQQKDQGLLGTSLDDFTMPGQDRLQLVYGALHVPELLLAVLASPHADALTAWLPLAPAVALHLKGLLSGSERCGADTAQAAFPDLKALLAGTAGSTGALGTAVIPGGWSTAKRQWDDVLWQLHGCVMTGERLVKHWQLSDGSGSGSGAELLDWLSQQLPQIAPVDDERKLRLPEDSMGAAAGLAPESVVRDAAAAAVGGLDGVAAVMGAPPPWGQDVKSDAVIDFMRSAACRSAALCALHLLDILLRGVPQSIRTMARRAADKPRERLSTPLALNPIMTLNPDGTLGPQGPHGCAGDPSQRGGDTALLRDGFDARELVFELLQGGVLDVLERGLRTATVALRASDGDLVWCTKSGSQQDVLDLLQARTAAAALMRATCSTTASLLVHLSDADTKPFEACGLLDAIVCAHTAVVTCSEGLQASTPLRQLSPYLSRATDPGLDPLQATAADAAVSAAASRALNSRVLMLLEARQALAVCLRAWQLQGWWPDPVGALMGVFPRASPAGEAFAKEDEAARKAGDPFAPPAPAPRQGPRQLLASLLALADLCPEEWPQRGASQLAARQRDAHAAEGQGELEGSPFTRPSQMRLRGQLAVSLEAYWDRLEALITFGISCSSRLARLALVRMLARMCGVGGGTSPQLGPAVFGTAGSDPRQRFALRQRLEDIVQARTKLGARLVEIKSSSMTPQQKQQEINREVRALVLQTRGAVQVCEVLLPLCGSPSIKSVLTEHKAAGVLAKGVYVLVRPLADLQLIVAEEAAAAAAGTKGPSASAGLTRLAAEGQVLAGLLLQLVAVLMDPDISMNPWADSYTRELQDTPALGVGRAAIAYLLYACEALSPDNMALLADLLVGPSVEGRVRCLYDYPKGRFLLRLAARHWHLLATQTPAAGSGMSQAELQQSAEWAAAALEATQWVGGTNATHAASCAAIAQVMRELAGASTQEGEAVADAERTRPAAGSIPRFVTAVKTAIAAHKPAGQDSQSIPTLLSTAPLLLACDASCLDFWKASAASTEHAQANPTPRTEAPHSAASAASCGQDWWPQTQLVGLAAPRVRSRSITEVVAIAQTQQQQPGASAGQALATGGGSGNLSGAGESSEIPAVVAKRGHFGTRDGSRHMSVHVDDFENRQQKRAQRQQGMGQQQHAGPFPGGQMPPAGMMPPMGMQPMQMGPAAAGAAAAAMGQGMAPMGPGMVPPMMGPGGLSPMMGPGPMGQIPNPMMGPGVMGPGPMGQIIMGPPDPQMGPMGQMPPPQQQMLMQQQMLQQQQQQQMMMGGGGPGMMQQQQQQQQPQQQGHFQQGRPHKPGRGRGRNR